jgi:hypothetical protein
MTEQQLGPPQRHPPEPAFRGTPPISSKLHLSASPIRSGVLTEKNRSLKIGTLHTELGTIAPSGATNIFSIFFPSLLSAGHNQNIHNFFVLSFQKISKLKVIHFLNFSLSTSAPKTLSYAFMVLVLERIQGVETTEQLDFTLSPRFPKKHFGFPPGRCRTGHFFLEKRLPLLY